MQKIANLTFYGQLERNASINPDKIAIICGKEQIRWSELYKQVNTLASYILDIGLIPGDKVVLDPQLSKLNFVISLLSLSALGIVTVPVSDDNVEYVVDNSASKAIVVNSAAHDSIITKKTLIIGLDEIPKCETLFKGETQYVAKQTAMLLYTSGTTRQPKGVIVSYDNLFATVSYMNEFMSLTQDIIEYMVAPLNHAFGLGRFRAVLAVAGTMIFDDDKFNPARTILAIKNNNCNAISSVSSGFLLLMRHFSDYLKDFGKNIRWIEIGSMPMDQANKEKMLEYFPKAKVVMNYGMTEAMRSTMLDLRCNPNKLNTVGKASPGNEILIFDEQGMELPANEKGEIAVKGPHLAMGYLHMDDFWQQQMQQGFYKTKDLGIKDEDGFITFLGRKGDMINIEGYKLSPIEIESELKNSLDIKDLCIIGVADTYSDYSRGDCPVLCIEGDGNIDHTSRKILSVSKLNPQYILNFKTFPRTQNGKIQRERLKAMVAERLI